MTAFIVEHFGYREKKLIKKYVKRHNIKRYEVYSLNNDVIKKSVRFLNINKNFFEMQDMALNLLDRRERQVRETSEVLSGIMGLNLETFTRRLLLNKVFYKEAQFLSGEEILLKEKKIKDVVILNKYENILTNKDNVINYSGGLNGILLLKSVFKYAAKLLVLSLRGAKNLKEGMRSIHREKYDLIAVQSTPLCYRLVEKTLSLLKNKYSIAIASGFVCNKELIPFKVQKGISKIKICPKLEVGDFLELIRFFKFLKLRKYRREIISVFDNILFRKKISEYVAKKFKPKIVLVKNDHDLFENIERRVFDKYRIKYIDYMHGEKFYWVRDSFLDYHKISVWGKYYKRLLEKKLRAKEGMIEVVGNQLFDEISSYHIEDKNLLELKDKYEKIIGVFTQTAYGFCKVDHQSLVIQRIVDFLKQNKNIYMILKHHPLEFQYPTPCYDLLLNSIKDRVLECTNEIKLYDILSISDLVVTPYSVVGLEAILFKKPVLYMNFGEVPHLIEYAKVNAAVEINNPEESEFYLNKMLFDKEFIESLNYEKVIEDWANALD